MNPIQKFSFQPDIVESLKQWINPKYLESDYLYQLHKQFSQAIPFEHLVLEDFLIEEKLDLILDELSDEEFYERESDLFQFMQTNDLISANSELLRDFRNFLCSLEFITWMQTVTSVPLIENILDLSGNLYTDTDYLLCHDDGIEEMKTGRRVAFIYYGTDLEEEDGGTLNLFNSDGGLPNKVVKKIIPKYNQFAFFKISKISFHEVEEVYTEKFRITLTGWFHGN
jgi:prolyl 3-hydroxylase /prolyl 3,4-dihydroxylase